MESDDGYIRGFSVKALHAINDKSAHDKIKAMTGDYDELVDYNFDTGKLSKIKISEFAKWYLNRQG